MIPSSCHFFRGLVKPEMAGENDDEREEVMIIDPPVAPPAFSINALLQAAGVAGSATSTASRTDAEDGDTRKRKQPSSSSSSSTSPDDNDLDLPPAKLASIFVKNKRADHPEALHAHIKDYEGKSVHALHPYVNRPFSPPSLAVLSVLLVPKGFTRMKAPVKNAHRSPIWDYGVRMSDDTWVEGGTHADGTSGAGGKFLLPWLHQERV